MANLVPFKTPQEVTDDLAKQADDRSAQMATPKPKVVLNLASWLDKLLQQAKDAKEDVEIRLLRALRARNGTYEPDHLAAMQSMFGPSYTPIYMNITGAKCRAAESWITETIFQTGKRPFAIEPTPIPELPPGLQAQVKQEAMAAVVQRMAMMGNSMDMYAIMETIQNILPEVNEAVMKKIREVAKENAVLMEDKVQDQFIEGDWYDSLQRAFYDFVTYGTMILKGPCLRKSPVRIREYDENTGRWTDVIEERIIPVWERRSPFSIFPSPDATAEEIPWIFDEITISRKALSDLIGVEGYDEKAIKTILERYRDHGKPDTTWVDDAKNQAEGKDSSASFNTSGIKGHEFHGTVPGSLLRQWGMSSKDIPHLEREYDAIVWKIDDQVIKAILNPDPMRKKYFYRACFAENPDSFWGQGVPDLLAGVQSLANSTARAIAQNVAIASGPQVELNVERLAPGENESIYPWKVWRVTNGMMQEGRAVEFYQPNIVTERLIEVFNFCMAMADEDSGIPRYMQGNAQGVSGAGETSSGLNMLMSHAAKGIRHAIRNIDLGVISPSVESCYYYNIEYEEDLDIIGDIRVVARGSSALVAKEHLAIRRTEFLNTTMNPVDVQLLGEGRKKLLAESIRMLELDPDEIFPEEDEAQEMVESIPPAEVSPSGGLGGSPKSKMGMIGPDGMPVKGHATAGGFSSQQGSTP